jgi:hypothetical protein
MKIPDVELMLFSDGELDEERARRIRVARLHHAEVGERLESIERVGSLVRVWAETAGVDASQVRRRTLRAAERRRTFGALGVALVALAAMAEPVAQPRTFEVAHAKAADTAIESVDFGSHGGTVFVLEAGDNVTPVVWLDDDSRAGG